ncbi:TfoX/Sxy family protein [Burkholderia sp. S-53]|uniref:TfoX/Sxy family protein n=1 Tax=Burkholderia sp. S-53 TaxID=2906514 RepID=UPI0021CEF383|nr:TfoX/Sxy family protein [Burkholderia sp. S-53]UXU91635.1 TfoX/Sxy family protein [Burkholderia sp. S-53]
MSWQADKAHGEEIAYQIASLGHIEVTRFFSGAALRLDGVMFGFLARGSMFLRVDDVNRPAFVAAGMGPFSYSGRTRTVALEGYYETPADVLEDAGALFDWCRGAYRAALLAGPPKRKARAAPKTASGTASTTAPKPASKTAPKPASKAASKPTSKPTTGQKSTPASKRPARPSPETAPKTASKSSPTRKKS